MAIYNRIMNQVEAMQFTGGNFKEVFVFLGNNAEAKLELARIKELGVWQIKGNMRLHYRTPGQEIKVNVNEWVIKNLDGEVSVMDNDTFVANYEEDIP